MPAQSLRRHRVGHGSSNGLWLHRPQQSMLCYKKTQLNTEGLCLVVDSSQGHTAPQGPSWVRLKGLASLGSSTHSLVVGQHLHSC